MDDDDVEAVASAFVEASRTLMGISLRSIAAAPVSLTVPQHRLLLLISADGSRRVGELAADLAINQSNASRLIDRLVTLGLVRRVRDHADGRASVITPTRLGHRTLDAVTQHRLRELRCVVQAMHPAARADAVAVLDNFNAANRDNAETTRTTNPGDQQ